MLAQKPQVGTSNNGRMFRSVRDPPGQSSVYIKPGDTWKENYRLATFSQFPNSHVFATHLAASGFYFTGFRDRVKCFSCGLCVENWVESDNPIDQKWHDKSCDYSNGRDTYNQPLSGPFHKWRTSVSQQNTQSTIQRPSQTSLTKFQSSHVPLVPNLTEAAGTLLPYHSVTSSANTHNTEVASQQNLNTLYSCDSPINAHMTSVNNRLESFKPRNGIRWPAENLRACIEELVNAGFFYLRERDRVKCFYCNGGLQNWDYEDDPWTEHVKWFPSCEYALRVKGPGFVENIVNQFPNLDRPVAVISNRLPGRDIGPALCTAEAVDEAMVTLPYAKHAREMGFAAEAIKAVLTRKYNADRIFYNCGENFMEALFAHQAAGGQPNHEGINQENNATNSHQHSSVSKQSGNTNTSPVGVAESNSVCSLATEFEELEKSRLCKICAKSPSNIVFIPCGHLASCEGCLKNLKKCPICKNCIQDKIKTYRA